MTELLLFGQKDLITIINRPKFRLIIYHMVCIIFKENYKSPEIYWGMGSRSRTMATPWLSSVDQYSASDIDCNLKRNIVIISLLALHKPADWLSPTNLWASERAGRLPRQCILLGSDFVHRRTWQTAGHRKRQCWRNHSISCRYSSATTRHRTRPR